MMNMGLIRVDKYHSVLCDRQYHNIIGVFVIVIVVVVVVVIVIVVDIEINLSEPLRLRMIYGYNIKQWHLVRSHEEYNIQFDNIEQEHMVK
jgi:hypothetical protein